MTVPESQTTETQPVGTVPTHAVPIVVAAVVISLLPFLVAIVVWGFRSWTPISDMAIIDLRVRDMFGPNTTLTGAYSRYGWNHPGPFQFWTVALMGLPFGRPAWATLVGHVVLQIVPISLAMWWAARGSRLALVATAVFVAICYGTFGSWMIIEPWNPHVAYAWWICLLVASGLISVGERRLLAPVLVVATILVQMHLGYLPLVAPILMLVLWWTWRDSAPVRSTLEWDRRRWWRSLGIGTGVATVISLPILINQVRGDPGNLTAIWRYFTDPHHVVLGLPDALAVVGEGFAFPPQWAGHPSEVDALSGAVHPRSLWWMLVGAALLVLGWVAARGVSDRALRLMTLATIGVASGVVAVSRVTDTPYPYLFYWRVPLAVFTWGSVIGVIVVRLKQDDRLGAWAKMSPGRQRLLGIVAVVVVAARVLPLSLDVAESPPSVSRIGDMEETVRDFVGRTTPRALQNERIWIRRVGGTLLGLETGVVNGLDRNGVDVRTGPGNGYVFGGRRAAVDGVGEVWYVLEGGAVGHGHHRRTRGTRLGDENALVCDGGEAAPRVAP